MIVLDVKNRSERSVTVNCRVDNPGANGRENCVTDRVTLGPKSSGRLMVRFLPSQYRLSKPLEIIGMRGYPVHQGKLDPSNVTQLVVFVNNPKHDHEFEIDNIRAVGTLTTLDSDSFLPFIDKFGQFAHADWPGKTHSLKELKARIAVERKDLAANPGPARRNKYGGAADGPKFESKGFFTVRKVEGKWWLIDPEGNLFWSHGVDCVHPSGWTPITDRRNYYMFLPEADSPLAQFYGSGSWAPHGYYEDHKPYKTYDFTKANLLRKFGPDWQTDFAEITHKRLRSWGFNTIANWSDSNIYLMRKTPYTATISFGSRTIEGSQGYWGKFYDVFDPSFRTELKATLKSHSESIGDPWCIGFFVHNEIAWGDDTSLAVAALASPADQPAKKVFIADLKAKYRTIHKLNAAWSTEHESWDALLKTTEPPEKEKASEDLAAFYTRIAETYFSTIREEFKKVAPDQLYMGCRFAWVNDRAIRAAAKYCDVISFNRYTYSVADQSLPAGIDKPIIIGEFHFGALDRGMLHTGLRKTIDQEDRAACYDSYVRGALRNPFIIGTHWFQYKDQATTGRGDGENYQIGFLDVCDRPYPEIVKTARSIGDSMYEYRLTGR